MRLLALPLLFLFAPLHANALDCAPVPATSPMAAMPGCIHGVPVRQGDLILVPRVCQLTVNGAQVARRTVDVRNGETGARMGAVSLPPVAIAADQFVPGAILPGEPPLLAYPTGIAAIDARASRAEVSFEAQGRLIGVARHADLLLVAELQAPDKQFVVGSIQLTVIDQEAGDVLGDLQLAGTALDGLTLRPTQGKGVELALTRLEKAKPVELVASLKDAAGKSTVKQGVLVAHVRPLTPLSATPVGCAVLPTATSAIVDRPWVAVHDGKMDRNVPNGLEIAAMAQTDACAAVSALATHGSERVGMAWFDRAGKPQLQAVRCK